MKPVLPLLFLLFSGTIAGAQTYLRGQVLAENDEKIGFCHVYNKTMDLGKVSDINGKFELLARRGDSVVFSYVGYQKVTLPVSSVHLTHYLKVMLPEDSVLLPSITIYADRNYRVPINMKGQPMFMEGVSLDKPLERVRPGSVGLGTAPGIGGMPSGGATIYGPITYFSRDERELRKAEVAYAETKQTITYQKFIAQDSVKTRLCELYRIDSLQYDQVIIRLHTQFPGIQKSYRPQEIWNWLLSHFDRTVPLVTGRVWGE